MCLNKRVNFIVQRFNYFFQTLCGLMFSDKYQSNPMIPWSRHRGHNSWKNGWIWSRFRYRKGHLSQAGPEIL